MNTNKYVAFLKTIEYKSLTKAAKELSYTQPAITHMIHSLEKEFGIQLLYRRNDCVELTADAERILPYIRNVVQNENNLFEELNRIRNVESGRINIGTYMSISTSILPILMQAFRQDHPGIRLSIHEGNTQEMRNLLTTRAVDFAIVAEEAFQDFDFIPLMEDHLKVILPDSHPLTKHQVITPHALFQYPMISMEEGSQEDLDRIIQLVGEEPNIVLRAKSEFTSLRLVASDMGVSVIPELFVMHPYPGVTVRDLDCEYSQRTLGIAMVSENDLSPSSRAFLEGIPRDLRGYVHTRLRWSGD